MKIVQVAHGYPPYSLAGVEIYTRWFALAQARRHEVAVFTTRQDPGLEDLTLHEEVIDGLPVTILINNFTDYDPILEVRHEPVAERFGAFLDRVRPDLVHFQHLIKLSTTMLDACRARSIPGVVTLHDFWFLCPLISLLQRNLEVCRTPGDLGGCTRCEVATSYLNREEAGTYYLAGMLESMMEPEKWAELAGIHADRFDPVYPAEQPAGPAAATLRIGLIRRHMRDRFDLADALASPSRFLKNTLERHGLAPGRIRHLPYGIDTSAVAGCDTPPPPPPLKVLYLGTVNKHKGTHVLIEAANRLRHLPIEVDVLGTTPDVKYDRYLREIAANPKIAFGGRYDWTDLRRLLGTHHVMVMPSIWYENYPIVIRESFAAGVPVVASDLGAIPEAIRDGHDGLLFAPGDADALAACLERLLVEPGLLSRLRNGIEPVLRIEEQVPQYETLYAEAIDRAARPPAGDRPHRILLAGPSDSSSGFARALGDLLIAGERRPRPVVVLHGENGDLAAPLEDFVKRLGLSGSVRSAPTAPDDLELAVFLPGADPDGTFRHALESAGIPIIFSPFSLDAVNRALREDAAD